jgi:CheY-like chemotaxis protein
MLQTLLCIDDEPSICALHKLLFEVNGYRVLVAHSGPEALRLLEGENVDLVVLDYRMPEMTGDKVAEIIRSQRPNVPILMESAYTDLPESALKHVDAYLIKGEATENLLAKVKTLLRKKSNGSMHTQ